MKKTILNLFTLFTIAISLNSCASLTACDCWEQSYTKSGLEFDKMSEAQQKTRAKCVDLFKNENNMEAECMETTKNSDDSDDSLETKIVTMKLPPKKQQNKLNIGDKVFGGVIIEIDKSGLHGLVMASEDQDDFIIKQEDDLPNKGYNRAFKVCNELVLNGFSDWRLPQGGELTLIYTNGEAFLSKKPGMYLDKFSTEFFINQSGNVCYKNINQEKVNYYRSDYYKVRAVREF
jgi:hypothetical protein